MKDSSSLTDCPNCDTSLTNIITKHKLLEKRYVEFAKAYGSFSGDYLCTKCAKDIITASKGAYKKEKKEARMHTYNYISSFPILTISPPSDWYYKPIGLVTSQYKLDSLVHSDRVFDAMLDSRKGLFDLDGITNKGERMCIKILRQKCYMLEGNAIVGIDVDYQSYSGGTSTIVCMSGTAVMVDNIEQVSPTYKLSYQSFKKHISTIDKLKRFSRISR